MRTKKRKKSKKKNNKIQKAYFAGGCFWGIENQFNKLKGIVQTRVGYMGGFIHNPTYEMVSTDKTGHSETVEVKFNKNVISYLELLKYFFTIHDPTSTDKQGNDIGIQYRSIVFYINNSQKKIYLNFIKNLHNIKTKLIKSSKFYIAEDYHQKYSFSKKCKKINTENIHVFHKICKNNSKLAEDKNTGKYNKFFKNGIYYCSCCNTKLYDSKDKYETGSGWPAFSKTISEKNILYNPKNDEIRCSNCGSHLGHRTFDGPTITKIHDCINSTCLSFKQN